MIDYGKLIRERRFDLNMTQAQLSDLTCVDRCTISMIENNKVIGRIETMETILGGLGLELKVVEKEK